MFHLVEKVDFVFGRVHIDINVLRGDLQGHVHERVRALGQVGAVDHLDALLEGLGLDQPVVDEQEQVHPAEGADVDVRDQPLSGEGQSLK